MYDDTINLLNLEHIKDQIERIETRINRGVLTIELKLFKQQRQIMLFFLSSMQCT